MAEKESCWSLSVFGCPLLPSSAGDSLESLRHDVGLHRPRLANWSLARIGRVVMISHEGILGQILVAAEGIQLSPSDISRTPLELRGPEKK